MPRPCVIFVSSSGEEQIRHDRSHEAGEGVMLLEVENEKDMFAQLSRRKLPEGSHT